MRTIVTRVDIAESGDTKKFRLLVTYEDAASLPGEIVNTNARQIEEGTGLTYAEVIKAREPFDLRMHTSANITAL